MSCARRPLHLANSQDGIFAPDSSYRWMGSMAMDKLGDIALGYRRGKVHRRSRRYEHLPNEAGATALPQAKHALCEVPPTTPLQARGSPFDTSLIIKPDGPRDAITARRTNRSNVSGGT